MTYERGESALVVAFPAVEPLVGAWRRRFSESARRGLPAHVTIVYPFLAASRMTDADADELRRLCAHRSPFDVVFARVRRFSDVVYLEPEPGEPFAGLTHDVVARWPEAPPYGGAYDEVVPHLTVASGASGAVYAEIEAELGPRLPLSARVEQAVLYTFGGERWEPTLRLPFRTTAARAGA